MTATAAVSTKASKPAKSEPKQAPGSVVTDAAPKKLNLPDSLRGYHGELVKALAVPLFWTWDEAVTYAAADQPKAIARVLIRALHPELLNAELAVVFKEKMSKNGKTRGAVASKVGGKLQYFAEIDLLIEVNHEAWRWLTPERRIALIDHELCHFARNEDEDGTSYVMVPHDVEEFGAIVRRWGLWQQDLEHFASSVDKARQLDIFATPIAKADASVN